MPVHWSRIGIPLCLFDLHSPVAAKAKWDGKYYIGSCRFCDKPIIRRTPGTWRAEAVQTG